MIEFKNVTKVYKPDIVAMDNVSLHIDKGEFVFVLGPSGAGKSTFLKLMLREETATKGDVIVNGYNLTTIKQKDVPYMRRTLGVVFQDFRLIPTMSVYENIAFAMRATNIGEKDIKKRVPYILSLVGLTSKARKYPTQLSGGEQQRVALARALANNANTIIADEPTGNVDPKMSYEIVDLLNHINADGTTVIMVTHDLHLVKTFNHRVITIKNGVIESDCPDASHIDVEPYKFENPEDTVGSYFVEESGEDLDYLFQNYAVDVSAEDYKDPADTLTAEETNGEESDAE